MTGKGERTIIGLAISISAIALIAAVILAIMARQPVEQTTAETSEQTPTKHHAPQYSQSKPPAKSTEGFIKTDNKPYAEVNVSPGDSQKEQRVESIQDIIAAARTWQPVYVHWCGSMAPDFTLPDINGQQHKLSDYRGKDVIVVFWATWCGPCKMEIPNLIELRNTISQDKLAILAISNESPDLVKTFVSDQKINYTVLLNQGQMPIPYGSVTGIPCSFFIDTEGRIKLATEGLLSFDETKAILQAK